MSRKFFNGASLSICGCDEAALMSQYGMCSDSLIRQTAISVPDETDRRDGEGMVIFTLFIRSGLSQQRKN